MEKRRTQRISMMADLSYSVEGSESVTITKRVTDLSEGGLYVDTPVPADVGTVLTVRFKVDGQPVEAAGRVAFAQTYIGMGIEFTDMDATSRERVRAFVERLAPQLIGV